MNFINERELLMDKLKKIFKKILSNFLRILTCKMKSAVIFMFHRVRPEDDFDQCDYTVSVGNFKLLITKLGDNIIGVNQLIKNSMHANDGKYVFTFDDGYVDLYTAVYPLWFF